ncbi:2-phosphosulfolactate phosphatase [Clostridium sp.]|uniref:2-phosphosulfolactate phosphatase n=1 Tax=Clostridium sp. TaxID=1506 RepID=UPI00262AE5F6|nr:2-phosphosulfolactate phosphatase [Clostridium sp.]
MKVDIVISADHIKQEYLKDKIIVVIDMLRATSVITTALANGAKRVIPTLTVEQAFKIKEELEKKSTSVLLGGERKALKIEGFDFTNSPLEYTKEKVKGKTIVLSTTNGTRAINLSLKAKKVYIGAMINAKALIDTIKEEKNDIVFINSGTNGEFTMDDFICSGYMIKLLNKEVALDLSDIAKTAEFIYDTKDVLEYIKDARHYGVLKSLNLEEDITYCCKKDIVEVVPRIYIKDGLVEIR